MLVDLRPRAQLALKFVHVPDDAHDPRSLALFLTNLDLVANRIPSGEKTPRELCVDNSDNRRVSHRQNPENAAPHQWNLHRAEIFGPYGKVIGRWTLRIR